MKQKKKIILIMLLLVLTSFSYDVFAYCKRPMNSIFMGNVESVERVEKDNLIRIKAKGYIKGCAVYKEEVIAIVSEETIILPDECPKDGEEVKIVKVNPKEFKVEKGDTIFIVLSEAMTKSIPPQSSVIAIQVSKPN